MELRWRARKTFPLPALMLKLLLKLLTWTAEANIEGANGINTEHLLDKCAQSDGNLKQLKGRTCKKEKQIQMGIYHSSSTVLHKL